jgi:rhomboid protease GluP
MTQRAMICPRCRRLIGSEESSCSWCGAKRPGSRWLSAAWTSKALEGDLLIRIIIGANIGFYALSLLLGARNTGFKNPLAFLSPNGYILKMLGATGTDLMDGLHSSWTLISASYLHGGILHIFFNMMALRQIAPWVNREYGPSRMFIIYTLSGVFGFYVSYLRGIPFTVGASASLCGLIGSLLYFGKSRGSAYGTAVYREVSGWVVGLVLFGLMPGLNINNWAHGGGIVGGILLGMLLKYQDRAPENTVHRLLAVLCGVVTVGVLGLVLVSVAMRFV